MQTQAADGDIEENNLDTLAAGPSASMTTGPESNRSDVQSDALAVGDVNVYETLDVDDLPKHGAQKVYQPLPSCSVKLSTDKIKQHIKDGNLALEYKVSDSRFFKLILYKTYNQILAS